MKSIFQETEFPVAPGGDLYDWKEAATVFKAPEDGVYVIQVTASARNGKQNGTGDDDDLRMSLDGYLFGREEKHQAKTESLMIPGDLFTFSESGDFSIELWYDEKPTLDQIKIEIEGGAQYDRTKTLDRWFSNIAEWSELPADLKKAALQIRKIVGAAWDLTLEYADAKGFFTTDDNGNRQHNTVDNEADAFRHFIWSALLLQEFGAEKAELITTHHEIFWRDAHNKKDFTRGGIMDLWNNKQGREYTVKYPKQSPEELFKKALSEGSIVSGLDQVTRKIKDIILEDISRFLNET